MRTGSETYTVYKKVKLVYKHTRNYNFFSFLRLDGTGDFLLASCAQDAYIRLWRIAGNKMAVEGNINSAAMGEGDGGKEEKSDEGELKLTGNLFTVVDDEKIPHQYIVTLESVLLGKTKLDDTLKNEQKF